MQPAASVPRWKLPPLILSPFGEPSGPREMLDGARAGLMLRGLLSGQDAPPEQLHQRFLHGRYCEIAMYFYLGKDLLRWTAQCAEFAGCARELCDYGLRPESFLALLVDDAPSEVREKLHHWGVFEYQSIFVRAVGLHEVFEKMPEQEALSPEFIRNYPRFADSLFRTRLQLFPFPRISSQQFVFELYASGEYSRLLEREWGPA